MKASIETKLLLTAILFTAIACMLLAGPNMSSLWVLFPLILISIRAVVADKRRQKRHINAIKGFLILVLPLMWIVHIQWDFDINGFATGSSTGALVFGMLPLFCFVLGAIGYIIGYVTSSD